LSYYFFHHPLDAKGGVPGRYPFDVYGTLVDPAGDARSASFRIAVDSVGENAPGGNVDPCVFARPLALVHSFCRIDKRGGKYYVPGSTQTLAQCAVGGDILFYGHLRTARGKPVALYVDTVLVVARTASLPTAAASGRPGRPFRLELGQSFAERVLDVALPAGVEAWQYLQTTDIWRYNLADASPGRHHEYTGIDGHPIIVGYAATAEAASCALQDRTTSFVPLVDQREPEKSVPSYINQSDGCELWRQMTNWVADNPRLARGMKPPSRIPTALGETLYYMFRRVSGRGSDLEGHVALPPVSWTNAEVNASRS
jgi:hypothetical protein